MIQRRERFLVGCDGCCLVVVAVERSFAPTVDLVDARALNSQLTELGWYVRVTKGRGRQPDVKTYCPDCRHE